MLGKQIKDLRQRQGMTREELACQAQLPMEELTRIEQENVQQLPVAMLLSIVDSMKLKKAEDFASLMQLNGINRKLQIYCVGLPKTGTVSLTGIFCNYRSAHEMWQWDTHQKAVQYKQQKISKQELLEFLRDRDVHGKLEMDSAHFNRHYLDLLVEEFPKAYFLCTIRDCYSWLNSYINYFTEPGREAVQALEIQNGFPFDLPLGDCPEKKELIENFQEYIDFPLSLWGKSYRKMMKELPPERSMVIRTNELSGKIDEIARFLKIPSDSLVKRKSHLNRAEYHVNILDSCDVSFLNAKFEEHCGDVMEAWFPGYSLDDFLNKRPIPAL